MTQVAEANDIECWSTVKLLRIMETVGRINMAKVVEILEYWQYENDLPARCTDLRFYLKNIRPKLPDLGAVELQSMRRPRPSSRRRLGRSLLQSRHGRLSV